MRSATHSRDSSRPVIPTAAINASEIQHWHIERLIPYVATLARTMPLWIAWLHRFASSVLRFPCLRAAVVRLWMDTFG